MAEETTERAARGKPLEASFTNFVATLRLQVLVCLGLVPNPATKSRQIDLEQAKYLIDTLNIIQQKTQGNLDETERKVLEGVLYEVEMRYVDAVNASRRRKPET